MWRYTIQELVFRALAGSGKPNSIMDHGLGCVSWHTLRSTCVGYNFLVIWLRCWGHPSRVQSWTTVVETHMTKMPASSIKDRVRVTMTCGNMLSVHTTYPL
jgi:hypothetical protein